MTEEYSLPITADYLDSRTRAMIIPRLRSEIEEWCKQQLIGEYSVCYCNFADRGPDRTSFPYLILFENFRDLVIFKLGWE